jgi:hypothetical protein
MPCDSVITVSVDIGRMHPDITKSALVALESAGLITHYGGSIRYQGEYFTLSANGTLRSESEYGNSLINGLAVQLKRAGATEAIKQTARRAGWTVKTSAKTKNNQFTVSKRGF